MPVNGSGSYSYSWEGGGADVNNPNSATTTFAMSLPEGSNAGGTASCSVIDLLTGQSAQATADWSLFASPQGQVVLTSGSFDGAAGSLSSATFQASAEAATTSFWETHWDPDLQSQYGLPGWNTSGGGTVSGTGPNGGLGTSIILSLPTVPGTYGVAIIAHGTTGIGVWVGSVVIIINVS
jgi:hypothetical protein